MSLIRFVGDDRLRTAIVPAARWLHQVQLWRPTDPDQLTTEDVETAVLLLAGTFDLEAGGTAWPARGARTTPFEGRPMAVFLPKRTRFTTQRGSGEILLIAARQPVDGPEATGRDTLTQKPLLALAGSGKAFDPASGEWRPAETFPTAPESLPPRRFQRLPVGAVVVERVFAADYKAKTLAVDEAVVPADTTFRLGDVPSQGPCDEVLLFVRSTTPTTIEHDAGRHEATGDTVLVLSGRSAHRGVTFRSSAAPSYCVVAYAGKEAYVGKG